MLRVSTPAPIMETLELVRETRAGLKPWQRRGLVLQVLGSLSVAFRIEHRLVAAAGFFPIEPEAPGEEAAEIWFLCRPELAGHLRTFVRLARLTCARAAQDGTVRLRAFVRQGHAPGARLAVLCGLELRDSRAGFDLWEWRGDGWVRQETVRRQDGLGAERATGRGPAGAG
ncbi:MAG: hypothetical protein COT56_21090 [Methylobacterium sp. CG09_land_8_20_14_0_10_71_15]|nr:MAG: hypothetical protein COT56_21090 [Methylobacterium sp. CG09_land_8_20_14_0_10_71_15]GBU16248.1 hypothetical protein AwMethylo_04630 [Methylobacterium sp.]